MSAESLHDWARVRIPPFRSGLLDPDEEARMRSHLSECAQCRALADRYAQDAAPVQSTHDHIPESVLAAWPKARRNLRGLEREMMRQHLAACPECRQDLELLGYAPELPLEPELEMDPTAAVVPAQLAGEPGGPTSAPRADRAVVRVVGTAPSRPRRQWLAWAFGGWAAVATAASVVLMFHAGLPTRPPVPPSAGKANPPTPPPASVRPSPSIRLLGKPADLRLPTRGGSESAPVALTDSSGRQVAVAIPSQQLRPGEASSVVLQVIGPGGEIVLSSTHAPEEFSRGQVLLLSHGDQAWATGLYVLRLLIEPGPATPLLTPERRDFHFAIQVGTR